MEKKDVVVITDPEVIKIITESTRRKILALLRINDLSISQLAELIQKDQSTVYRHIKKLEAHNLVQPVGERKVHHIPEIVYGRVAKTYLIVPEIDENQPNPIMYYKRETMRKVMDVLEEMGYEIDSRRVVSREMYAFSKKLDNMISDDWKALENSDIHIDPHMFINTLIFLMMLKIEDDPELKDRMERLGELIKRKKE